jgi:hypothetical protein
MRCKGGSEFAEIGYENAVRCPGGEDYALADASPRRIEARHFSKKSQSEISQYGCVAASLMIPISLNIVSVLPHLSFRC